MQYLVYIVLMGTARQRGEIQTTFPFVVLASGNIARRNRLIYVQTEQ